MKNKTFNIVCDKYRPEILLGIGISGFITTTVLVAKATPKALELIEKAKEDKKNEKFSKIDAMKVAWKPYIPAVVMGSLSIFFLVGSNSASVKQKAALATAYTISESAYSEYRSKVKDILGEKKEKVIREEIALDKIRNNPARKTAIIDTGMGSTICYDPLSDRYFYHDIEKLRHAINVVNNEMLQGIHVTLNELYYEMCLGTTDLGDELGWCTDDGLIEVDYISKLTSDDEPCLVLDYKKNPYYIYCD